MAKKLVIGIHGLANKEKKAQLKEWWLKSIREGLNQQKADVPDFEFQMVYWADLLYAQPLHRKPGFEFDPLFNTEPYVAAGKGEIVEYHDGWRDDIRAAAEGVVGATVDGLKQHFGMNSVADWFLSRILKDLSFYYSERSIFNRDKPAKQQSARRVLRDELSRLLVKYQKRDTLLVAHSMGSIIAYDVLRELGTNPKNSISDFITIGSPLGLPHVKGKILDEARRDKREVKVRTPTMVKRRWVNFADKRDPVAMDERLRDDYAANKSGVRVEDDLVSNTYHIEVNGEDTKNHHKSYGYLRTPEFTAAMIDFLRA